MRTAVVTLPEIAAVYVDKYNNIANSTNTHCTIQGSNSWWYRTFLKYDTSLIPSGRNIIKATLHVCCKSWNDYAASGTTNISRVTTDWTETSVTSWSNQPSFTSSTYLSSNVNPPKVGEWSEWDITSLVREWVNGTPNYGLHIKNNNEGGYRYNWDIFNRRYNNGSHSTYISVEYESPPVFKNQGTAVYSIPLSPITQLSASLIEWSATLPDGTSVLVDSSIDNETWDACVSGTEIPSLYKGVDYRDRTLLIRMTLRTEDEAVTPSVGSLRILLRNSSDGRVMVLLFDAGVTKSIQRAVGDVTVAYDGSGTLMGQGGPVLAFEQTFSPKGLVPKNNPHDAEHVELVDVVTVATLSRIHHKSVAEKEHLNLSDITTTYALTHINDI